MRYWCFNGVGAIYFFTLVTERRRPAAWFRPTLGLAGSTQPTRVHSGQARWRPGSRAYPQKNFRRWNQSDCLGVLHKPPLPGPWKTHTFLIARHSGRASFLAEPTSGLRGIACG
jgi:hypothetical protein